MRYSFKKVLKNVTKKVPPPKNSLKSYYGFIVYNPFLSTFRGHKTNNESDYLRRFNRTGQKPARAQAGLSLGGRLHEDVQVAVDPKLITNFMQVIVRS